MCSPFAPQREDISGPEEAVTDPDENSQPILKPEKAKTVTLQAHKVNGAKPVAGKVALNADAKAVVGKLALSTPVAPVAQTPIIAPAVVSVNISSQNAAPPAAVLTAVVTKDRKKKKGEFATLQQMISEYTFFY
jgi:hypothetical protein